MSGPYTLHVCDYSQSCSCDHFNRDRALCVLLIGEELWSGGDLIASSVHSKYVISDSDCPQKRNFGAALSPFTVAGQIIFFLLFREYGLSYLSLRASIGLWTAILCIILVATDASSLVCYITRFTEEAFASLICIIFIYEALEKLFHLSETYPINMHNNLELLTKYS